MSDRRITVVTPRFSITNSQVKPFMKRLNQLIDREGRLEIVLNLSHVEYVSTLGQIAIVSLANHLHASGGTMRVAELKASVKSAFEQTRLCDALQIFATVTDAVESLEQTELISKSKGSGAYYIRELNQFVEWDQYPQLGAVN